MTITELAFSSLAEGDACAATRDGEAQTLGPGQFRSCNSHTAISKPHLEQQPNLKPLVRSLLNLRFQAKNLSVASYPQRR